MVSSLRAAAALGVNESAAGEAVATDGQPVGPCLSGIAEGTTEGTTAAAESAAAADGRGGAGGGGGEVAATVADKAAPPVRQAPAAAIASAIASTVKDCLLYAGDFADNQFHGGGGAIAREITYAGKSAFGLPCLVVDLVQLCAQGTMKEARSALAWSTSAVPPAATAAADEQSGEQAAAAPAGGAAAAAPAGN